MNVDARARRAAAVVLAVRPDPVADAGFVGRRAELAQLLGLLAPDSHSPVAADDAAAGVVVVSAVAGAPGVGKTALAQAATRAAVAQDWFPGGAITVDLHGYDPDPAQVVWPAQVYAGALRALGVAGEQVPATEAEQATVYHQLLDHLAGAGRPVLLVWDNVSDPDQVAGLLPGGVGGHRALITSRDTLGRLPDARLLDLHVLQPAAAVELLAVGLRRRDPTDTRITRDPAAAARVVGLCGWLPLAVQIVAALLADEPGRPLAELADELADETTRLRGLDYDGRWAVRAAFDLSYRRLPPEVAELFGWLSAAPGPDVGLDIATVLAERPQPQVRAGLRALCRAHLLDQSRAGEGEAPRWRMHDLIRLYATEQLSPDQHAAGFARALAYYRNTALLAWQRFTASTDAAAMPAGFTTAAEAMAWVLAERAGLVAAVVRAAETYAEDAVGLAADLAPLLQRGRLLADWVTVADAAVRATSSSPDRRAAAAAWTNFGLALRYVRRFEEAIAAHQQDLVICRETGNRHGEGRAWGNLGIALAEMRRFEEAITAFEEDLTIHREVGDAHGAGPAWNNLGLVLRQVKRFEEAIAAHQQAGEIYREAGDRHGEGTAWNNLGLAFQQVEQFDEAIAASQRAMEILRETGNRHGEGSVWRNVGSALVKMGRPEEAIAAYQHGVVICAELADGYGQADMLTDLGVIHSELSELELARSAWAQAIALFTAAGADEDVGRVRQLLTGPDLDPTGSMSS